jgi:hypothetical protein
VASALLWHRPKRSLTLRALPVNPLSMGVANSPLISLCEVAGAAGELLMNPLRRGGQGVVDERGVWGCHD